LSFWAKFGMNITNLGVFKNMCDRHEVTYRENQDPNFRIRGDKVVATLLEKSQTYGQAYLVESGGGIKLTWDNDPHYNTLCDRLGQNGGKLTRDYATDMVRRNVMAHGGLITSQQEQADGSILLKAAVGGG
jgi:hypothetical protein